MGEKAQGVDGPPVTLQRAPQRQRVYQFILAEHAAGRGFPSKRTIADHMGWKHEESAYDALATLANLDHLLGIDPQMRPTRFFLKEIAG